VTPGGAESAGNSSSRLLPNWIETGGILESTGGRTRYKGGGGGCGKAIKRSPGTAGIYLGTRNRKKGKGCGRSGFEKKSCESRRREDLSADWGVRKGQTIEKTAQGAGSYGAEKGAFSSGKKGQSIQGKNEEKTGKGC